MLMTVARPHVKNLLLSVALSNPYVFPYVIFYVLFGKKNDDIAKVLEATKENIINSI